MSSSKRDPRAMRLRILIAVGIAICVLAPLAIWILTRTMHRGDQVESRSDGTISHLPPPSLTSGSDGGASVVGASGSASSRREAFAPCLVVDERNEPVISARLIVQETKDRYVPLSQVLSLAVSDSKGMMNLPDGWRTPRAGCRIALFAPGFCLLPESEIPGGESPAKIVMKRACSLAIQCIDHLGRPVLDACASISRTSADVDTCFAALAEEIMIPGPNPDSAIHLGRSDASGIISIGGLDGDEYPVSVQSSSMILEASLEKTRCGVATEITARFRPVWIVGLEIAGDRIIASEFNRPRDSRDVSAGVTRPIDRHRRGASQKWSNAALELGSQWGDAPPKISYRLLGERSGYYFGAVDATPLDAFTAPTVLTEKSSNQVRTRPLHFCFQDAGGLRWSIDKATQLIIEPPSGGPMLLPMDEMGKCVAPFGSISVRTLNKLIAGHVKSTKFLVDDSTPEEIRIPVDVRLRECLLEIVSNEGWTASNGYVSLSMEGRSAGFVASDLRGVKLVMPVGRGTAVFSAMNMNAKSVPFTVEPTSIAEPQTIRVEVQTSAN